MITVILEITIIRDSEYGDDDPQYDEYSVMGLSAFLQSVSLCIKHLSLTHNNAFLLSNTIPPITIAFNTILQNSFPPNTILKNTILKNNIP